MTKNELIEELQKIEGNPIISIGINKSWGKLSLSVSSITPLYNHDGHKVESSPNIFELNCDDNNPATEEQLAEFNRERLIRKYGPLSICSIEDRYWAVNGPWFDKWNKEKIEKLEAEITKLKNKG
jgi:hypothetical protein